MKNLRTTLFLLSCLFLGNVHSVIDATDSLDRDTLSASDSAFQSEQNQEPANITTAEQYNPAWYDPIVLLDKYEKPISVVMLAGIIYKLVYQPRYLA